MSSQAAQGFHLSSGQVHIPRQRGICAVCNLPVLDDQLRSKNQQGKYVHNLCTEVGGAEVVTQVYTPYQKGICAVCRLPVFKDQLRTKNQQGAYVHGLCRQQMPHNVGYCPFCTMPILDGQAYKHEHCSSGR